jgi:hypothetical protein
LKVIQFQAELKDKVIEDLTVFRQRILVDLLE